MRGTERPLELLLLCNYESLFAQNIRDHMDTLVRHSRHRVRMLSSHGRLPDALELDRFDGVLLHYSLFTCQNSDYLFPPESRARLAAFGGLKVAFRQDEYCSVNRFMGYFREMGVHLLFSCAPSASLEHLYPALPGVGKAHLLCGYADSALAAREVPPFAARPIDVGYRARQLPPWLGALGQEKADIADRFVGECQRLGLVCDLSHRLEDRIYGEGWIDFLLRCKATLGVAGGASVIDYTGEIEERVREHLAREPGLAFASLQQRYFAEEEARVAYNLLSPRHFEAAALRTLMILYEDPYLGVLTPWRHYVPLRKDHGNVDAVAAVLRDPLRCQGIIDRAYEEVACNPAYSWQAMAARVDGEVTAAFKPEMAAARSPYSDAAWARIRLAGWVLALPFKVKDHLPPGLRHRVQRWKRRIWC